METDSPSEPLLQEARQRFFAALFAADYLSMTEDGVASIADSKNARSKAIAASLISQLGEASTKARTKGQVAGAGFEQIVAQFLRDTFVELSTVRCGTFKVARLADISNFQQYRHLADIAAVAEADRNLKVALGREYIIKPDVVITREPVSDEELNARRLIADDSVALRTGLRSRNNDAPILHASISCKWTIRSDRSQNSRSEALNLIRNRKGRLPHIAVVTAEPSPSRIASVALGTGDIDCVYFIALPEFLGSVREHGTEDAQELLDIMVDGGRLKDIADLPLDLAT